MHPYEKVCYKKVFFISDNTICDICFSAPAQPLRIGLGRELLQNVELTLPQKMKKCLWEGDTSLGVVYAMGEGFGAC